jgi:hypothetical protein
MIAAMKRRLVRVAAFLPVPLLALVLSVWAHSYAPEDFYCRSADGRVLLFFISGEASRTLYSPNNRYHNSLEMWEDLSAYRFNAFHFRCLGIEAAGTRALVPGHLVAAIPFGWIALPLAAASAWWAVDYRRRRARERPGSCPA